MTMGNDYRSDLRAFLAELGLNTGPAYREVPAWQMELLERLVKAKEGGARIVAFGTPVHRGDWLRRAFVEPDRPTWRSEAWRKLAELEASAERELAQQADGFREWTGVDLGAGDDRTVYSCAACGFSTELLEDLANHAIRGHRWPEFDGTL